jgi:hypothetical protein
VTDIIRIPANLSLLKQFAFYRPDDLLQEHGKVLCKQAFRTPSTMNSRVRDNGMVDVAIPGGRDSQDAFERGVRLSSLEVYKFTSLLL